MKKKGNDTFEIGNNDAKVDLYGIAFAASCIGTLAMFTLIVCQFALGLSVYWAVEQQEEFYRLSDEGTTCNLAVMGTLNVAEAVTFDTTLGVTGVTKINFGAAAAVDISVAGTTPDKERNEE